MRARLETHSIALVALDAMARSGGVPGVIGRGLAPGEHLFCDCSTESPADHRSLCCDRAALNAHKENKPGGSAVEAAAALGIELLDEAHCRALQRLGEFDLKTSSWAHTPPELHALGGARLCDRRCGQAFTHHNGVQSYYAAHGLQRLLRV